MTPTGKWQVGGTRGTPLGSRGEMGRPLPNGQCCRIKMISCRPRAAGWCPTALIVVVGRGRGGKKWNKGNKRKRKKKASTLWLPGHIFLPLESKRHNSTSVRRWRQRRQQRGGVSLTRAITRGSRGLRGAGTRGVSRARICLSSPNHAGGALCLPLVKRGPGG